MVTIRLSDGTESSSRSLPAIVGRALDADIRLPESCASVSRRHAQIYEAGGQYWIHDLNSANGTKVDGVRISGPTPITCHSRLTLGETEMVLTASAIPQVASSTFSSPDLSGAAGGVSAPRASPVERARPVSGPPSVNMPLDRGGPPKISIQVDAAWLKARGTLTWAARF